MDYFSLFDLPVCYEIDKQLLTTRYQDLQRQFHPDKFARHSEHEQMQSIAKAATINEAYQALKHPLKRAEYMLFLQGIDINNEQHTMHDTAFLMEQLELREELDNIERTKDSTLLAQFATRVNAAIAKRSAQMINQLDDKEWIQAADTVRKLRFSDKLLQQAELIEERLLDNY